MPSSRRKVTENFNGGLRAARPTLDTAKLLFTVDFMNEKQDDIYEIEIQYNRNVMQCVQCCC